MTLGSLEINSPYLLAPMAGYTDKPFRSICKEFGAGLTVSELISVNAIYYNNQKTFKLIERNDNENPFCIQLFGSDPDIFLYAAQKIEELCDCIDINAGCPVAKVVKTFSGSYLLKENEKLFAILDKLKKHIKKPISIKMRKGFDSENINSLSFYKELESRGANFITIHPRLRNQFFSGEVDYEHAAEVARALNIDVVVNGGIDSIEKANYVQKITGCKYLMIGQAAISKPYIFEDLINQKTTQRTPDFIKQLINKHFELMLQYYPEIAAIKHFRKFFHHYTKGLKFAKTLNSAINNAKTKSEVYEITKKLVLT
jgi:tRNA-dihydrouridine synthase B